MTSDLLHVLIRHATQRGLVLANEASLEREARASTEQLRRSLSALAKSGAVEILSPLPFLVLKLRSWSSMSHPAVQFDVKSRPSREAPIDARGFTNAGEVGGAGEGEGRGSGILREILDTLGESDAAVFAPILDHYSPSIIRTALRRVARTRPENIRTSRTALFRYLLVKLSR